MLNGLTGMSQTKSNLKVVGSDPNFGEFECFQQLSGTNFELGSFGRLPM